MRLNYELIEAAVESQMESGRPSQTSIAEAVGMTNITLRNWMEELPKSIIYLQRISELTGASMDELILKD
jgi:hypothetical protein